ncbi:MAG: hypothetical protein LBC96_03520 [Lachnospiraceae bacterium]|jgi:glycogen operon protein|nr:hypothetical protein [Lachnospiraceae bacterium]
MNYDSKHTYFAPCAKGVTVFADSIAFATDLVSGDDCGVLIFDGEELLWRIPFSAKGKRGCLLGLKVKLTVTASHSYLYYQGNESIIDTDARLLIGNKDWGVGHVNGVRCGFYIDDFDWEDSKSPENSKDNFVYGLNVRSFTMHKSSKVKKKGTFAGVIEKIPYLSELGVTAVHLMPAYDFDEREEVIDKVTGSRIVRSNCWGFKDACYFAPKSAYADKDRPDHAFKEMVKSLHQIGIAVYMYFYFSPLVKPSDILEILRFWVIEYHLDGVHIMGFHLPFALITKDPVLSATKIIFYEQDYSHSWDDDSKPYANTVILRSSFRNDVRRFLKGDEDMINAWLGHMGENDANGGIINFLTNYDGFSLFDMTAYDQKHNEANGENNSDGTDYNYSWNCGIEGASKRAKIVALRSRQMKNALALLFLSQGTPYLYSGDELANTRYGNNNAYCQDNEIGHVKWAQDKTRREIQQFVKELSEFRRRYPVLSLPGKPQLLDWLRCGYPDMSFHGAEAWRPDLTPYSRTLGTMLCGRYAPDEDGFHDYFVYIAVNMHWQKKKLALPHLPPKMTWELAFSTADSCGVDENTTAPTKISSGSVEVNERSVTVFVSIKNSVSKGKGFR